MRLWAIGAVLIVVMLGAIGCSQEIRAIQDYDEVIRLNPQHSEAYYNKGNAYTKLGQPERAIDDYDEAIRLDPQFASAYYNRGLAYHHLGPVHADLSIQDYETGLRRGRPP